MLPKVIEHLVQVTEEEVCRNIQAANGKETKVRLFGHVSRSSALAKTFLQGTASRKKKKR